MATTGTITQIGYQVLHTGIVGGSGMGFAISVSPPLPSNPCYGVVMLVLDQINPPYRFVGAHKSVWRDGVVVFPPYGDVPYDIVFVAKPPAIGKDFYIQL